MLGKQNMEATIYQTLSACLSHDPNVRVAGENRAKELAQQVPDYAKYLTQIALAQTLNPAERQLATITLKNYVATHWSSKDDKFTGPEPPEEVKADIRTSILTGVKDPSKSIRVASASVISNIAHFDWPESWPTLLETLMSDIQRGTPEHVHGAMRVLAEFMRDDLTDQHFPYIAPALLPELHRIFCAADLYTPRDRARALGVFRDFANIAYMVSEEHPEVVSTYVEPVLPIWMDAFKSVLAHVETPPEVLPVKHEVLRTVCRLIKQFPKPMCRYIVQLLEPVWNHLVALQQQYISERVNPVGNHSQTEDVDSDGEVLGFDSLLYSLVEYIELATRRKSLRHMFTIKLEKEGQKQAGQFLNQLITLLLLYIQITEELEETWNNDMNAFIQDDEEEATTFNVRIAMEELLLALVDTFPLETLQALVQAIQVKFQESSQAREGGDLTWWKIHEACLLALGRVSDELLDALQNQSLAFDIAGLFDHVILADIRCNEFPFLQGRALWFASQFSGAMPSHLISQYMGAAIEALVSDVPSPAVKVSALKALRGFCSNVDSSELVPFQSRMIEGILRLFPSASGEALALLLETLGTAARVNEEVTAQYANPIGNLILNVWVRGAEDFILSEIIVDVFNILAANKVMIPQFQQQMLPAVQQVLRVENVENAPWVVGTALTLMTALIKHAPDPFPPSYTTSVFPDLIKMLLVVDDQGILQNGQDAIKELVQRDISGLARWSDGAKPGLDYIISFIAKLLHPEQSESAGIFVGDLIIKLIQKGGTDHLNAVLPDLLRAVAQKLRVAKTPSFIQQLVMIFAHLTISQPAVLLEFLSSMNLEGKNGLALVLEAWCDFFTDFQGFYSIKVSAVAMTKLFLNSGDPRLANLTVKGDEIVTSNRIRTRSMAHKQPTQYTMIPFPAKAIKLLIAELRHQMESQMGRPSRRGAPDSNEDGEGTEGSLELEDEEWEDIPEDLAGLINECGDDIDTTDFEGADSTLWNDPIYQMDLRAHLTDFFKTCARENTNGFIQLCESYLNDPEKKILTAVIA